MTPLWAQGIGEGALGHTWPRALLRWDPPRAGPKGGSLRFPIWGTGRGAPAHLDPCHHHCRQRHRTWPGCAGIGVEDCLGMAKAAEQGQHGVQLGGRGTFKYLWGVKSP